jgi:hypothetical protein
MCTPDMARLITGCWICSVLSNWDERGMND